ncbi:hypothetical protein L211DRAFT_898353 [Terfezia boudieri ATCC MYA-4762]|uniref:Uncharacterized protein n=1 Tax=Terfezia boudieri ATCC MYA-4762 TaxID=1051890 RepID=A0A3N4L8I9_9PEZI|nr:hypothetical protein L211DRAFT_898353 [Terfezia boudieri ATCC MYA-4762]
MYEGNYAAREANDHIRRAEWKLDVPAIGNIFRAAVGIAHILTNTKSKVDGKATTLRQALDPIVKLAAEVDTPSGCSAYGLVRQMAKRPETEARIRAGYLGHRWCLSRSSPITNRDAVEYEIAIGDDVLGYYYPYCVKYLLKCLVAGGIPLPPPSE